jgi:hypothetical protein
MPNHHYEDKISLPAKIHLETLPGGVGRPPLGRLWPPPSSGLLPGGS